MAKMVTLLPIVATISMNPIPTEAEIEAVGEKMDGFVEKVKELLPEGVELLLPDDPNYFPAIMQAANGLLNVVDPESAATADRALQLLNRVEGREPSGGPGPTLN